MVTISKKAEYAIAALSELATSTGSHVSARSVASMQLIPPNLISQLLATMARAGWISTIRGPRGGARLERDPASISLYDVVQLFDGEMGITRCLSGRDCPRAQLCGARPHMERAQRRMVETLQSTTIADVTQPVARPSDA